MKHCRACLYPETKPNLWFAAAGLCSACIAFNARSAIDWNYRRAKFVEQFPAGTRVVVACSGGKDSTYIIVKLKELGLDPLAVCATTDHLSAIGRRNLDNIGNLCELIEVTPNKDLRRKMSRHALETVGDISWCEHQTIWSIPSRIAKYFAINYVFYGENPQNEYGAGPAAAAHAAEMSKKWEAEFGGLNGLRLSDMEEKFPDGDFSLYRIPTMDAPARIFLGYYFPWDGAANACIAKAHGFEWNDDIVETSLCRWENLDNHQTGIHDYLRYVKFGYTRATDIASNLIRRGQFSREVGRMLVRETDPFPSTYLGMPLADILAPLKISMENFKLIVFRFTNKQLFDTSGDFPKPKFEID